MTGDGVRGVWLGLGLTWFVALNLRTGLIGIGPVLPGLTNDLGLSATQGSLLVALPTAMMGAAAAAGGRMVDRWGPRTVIVAGLALVAAGGGLRAAVPDYLSLMLVTLIFGMGIGIAQPALPRLARGLAGRRIGFGTGVYTSGFFCGSVLSAFLTAPVLLPLTDDRTWRLPLLGWGLLSALALIVWIGALPGWRIERERAVGAEARRVLSAGGRQWSPWRDRGAWIVAALFLTQGLAYYLLIAWLPAMYEGVGLGSRASGALFAVFNLGSLPGMVGLPALSDKLGNRRPAAAAASMAFLVGVLGLAVAPDVQPWQWVWPFLAGLGVGGVFALALVLPVDVAPKGRTGVVAGMVLAVGYLGSAAGPVIGGAIRDLTGSFTTAIAFLPVVGVVMIGLSFVVPELARRNV